MVAVDVVVVIADYGVVVIAGNVVVADADVVVILGRNDAGVVVDILYESTSPYHKSTRSGRIRTAPVKP